MVDFFRQMTKAQTERRVREIVNAQECDVEFTSDFIADLIVQRHYYCAAHDLRPHRFRKTDCHGKRYDFWGWFDSIGWHKVSWLQCVKPKSMKTEISGHLRRALRPVRAAFLRDHPTCCECSRPSSEWHHVTPTFDQMVEEGMGMMTSADWKAYWAAFDWKVEEAFETPKTLPLWLSVRSAHDDAEIHPLCSQCHKKAHGRR